VTRIPNVPAAGWGGKDILRGLVDFQFGAGKGTGVKLGQPAAFFIAVSVIGEGVMGSYPVEIRRCRHIRTNGTQCGSPALKRKKFCYYHQENQPGAVELYIDGQRYSDGEFMLPVFEDAHSIQTALRQVVTLMFQRRIDRKDAGLMLYALQIASGNLKTMQAERAKPTHVVVEPRKTGETPLGMTPWSASGQGHDVEEEQGEEVETAEADEPVIEIGGSWTERLEEAMITKRGEWSPSVHEFVIRVRDRINEKLTVG
jgi:hypothetical protein